MKPLNQLSSSYLLLRWSVGLLALIALVADVADARRSRISSEHSAKAHNQTHPFRSPWAHYELTADDMIDLSDEPSADDSRTAVGGEERKSFPKWFVPIFGAKICSETDGHLCGLGIRVSGTHILASSKSMQKALSTFSDISFDPPYRFYYDKAPGLFDFYMPLEINISKPYIYTYLWKWNAYPKRLYTQDLGLYTVIDRTGMGDQLAKEKPITEPVKLATKEDGDLDYCRAMLYGSKTDSSAGIKKPMRKLVLFRTDAAKCYGNACDFTKPNDPTWISLHIYGGICGVYSDLGAPIYCGQNEDTRVAYIIHEVDNRGDVTGSSGNCNMWFKAVRVSSIVDRIKADIRAPEIVPTSATKPPEPRRRMKKKRPKHHKYVHREQSTRTDMMNHDLSYRNCWVAKLSAIAPYSPYRHSLSSVAPRTQPTGEG